MFTQRPPKVRRVSKEVAQTISRYTNSHFFPVRACTSWLNLHVLTYCQEAHNNGYHAITSTPWKQSSHWHATRPPGEFRGKEDNFNDTICLTTQWRLTAKHGTRTWDSSQAIALSNSMQWLAVTEISDKFGGLEDIVSTIRLTAATQSKFSTTTRNNHTHLLDSSLDYVIACNH